MAFRQLFSPGKDSPPQAKMSVLLDCFGQFLTDTNVKQSVRIDRYFNVFASNSYHELLAFEEVTAHWPPERMNAPSDSEVRVPPGDCASHEWSSIHTALSQKTFCRTITTGAKATIADRLYWLGTKDSSKSLQTVQAWIASPSWDTLHPLTGRYIVLSQQASKQNATENAEVAARH